MLMLTPCWNNTSPLLLALPPSHLPFSPHYQHLSAAQPPWLSENDGLPSPTGWQNYFFKINNQTIVRPGSWSLLSWEWSQDVDSLECCTKNAVRWENRQGALWGKMNSCLLFLLQNQMWWYPLLLFFYSIDISFLFKLAYFSFFCSFLCCWIHANIPNKALVKKFYSVLWLASDSLTMLLLGFWMCLNKLRSKCKKWTLMYTKNRIHGGSILKRNTKAQVTMFPLLANLRPKPHLLLLLSSGSTLHAGR